LPAEAEVHFEFSEPARPAVLRYGDAFLYVVMPMSI